MSRPSDPAEAADDQRFGKPPSGLRRRLYTIIFESDTVASRRFDIVLIAAILFSILVVVLDSVDRFARDYAEALSVVEWGITLFFTAEYVARIACVTRPLRYATSFFGIVDLLAILPTYLALLVPGAHLLVDVRVLRLLRVFRILKLAAYVSEYRALGQALAASRRKILIFLSVVLMLVLVLGTLMYVVEGPENGYTSIPVSVYWAIVTMTTVGYGDISPKTDLGRLIASVMMLVGWGILAVPTGIVSAEMTAQRYAIGKSGRRCPGCGHDGHGPAARYCDRCGVALDATTSA